MNGLRLEHFLKAKNVLAKDLAKAVGVSTVTISNIKNGVVQPRTKILLKIAKALDINISELFNPTKKVDLKVQIIFDDELHTFDSAKEAIAYLKTTRK